VDPFRRAAFGPLKRGVLWTLGVGAEHTGGSGGPPYLSAYLKVGVIW
jgi:hypothetical protein